MTTEQVVEVLLDTINEGRLWHLGPMLSGADAERMEAFRRAWERLHPVKRQDVVEALVKQAEEHVEYDFRPIFRWLLGDEDPQVRRMAIEGLWEDDSPALIGPLLYLLQQDPDPSVRAAAATGLGRFVLLMQLDEIPMREVTPAIEALLQKVQDENEDIEVRRRALEAISYLNEPHIKDLIEAAYYHPDLRMQVSAVFSMGRNLDSRWGPMVMAELESPDPELRYEAALAAGELELIDAVHLLRLLAEEDEDLDVRLAAVEALGRVGGPEAERVLMRLAESDNEALAELAEDALSELRFMSGADDLLLMDYSDDWSPGPFGSQEDNEELDEPWK